MTAAARPDPLAATAGTLALIVASSQPTYPLYVWLATGGGARPAAVVLLAVPAFLAVPWLARRASLAGRALLPLAGIANTVAAGWALGREAGLDLLLVACAAIAAGLLRAEERWVLAGIAGAAIAGWFAIEACPGTLFDPAGYAALRRLNAVSAIALCGLFGWLSPRRTPAAPPPPRP